MTVLLNLEEILNILMFQSYQPKLSFKLYSVIKFHFFFFYIFKVTVINGKVKEMENVNA